MKTASDHPGPIVRRHNSEALETLAMVITELDEGRQKPINLDMILALLHCVKAHLSVIKVLS